MFVACISSSLLIAVYSNTLTISLVNYDAMYDNECAKTMTASITSDICLFPAKKGSCRAAFNKYFYNSASGKCETFTYGGCRGNDNNFVSKELCEQTCTPDICNLPAELGLCKAAIPAFYYNSATKKCESFTYGGCGGNDNRFGTLEECETSCGNICNLPAEIGRCRATIPAFYYNSVTKQCEAFTYRGCGGNQNRFGSKTECEAFCGDDEFDESDGSEINLFCQCLGKIVNTDKSYEQSRIDFNSCIDNVHSIDLKNNLQETAQNYLHEYGIEMNDSEQEDVDIVQNLICLLPKRTGPCRGEIFRRYYYNAETLQCESFTYGGCRGNKNNFGTLEECENACSNICNLPAEVGRCKAAIPAFYYNSETKKCESFTYGGCGGNDNRFGTLEECENACLNSNELSTALDVNSKDKFGNIAVYVTVIGLSVLLFICLWFMKSCRNNDKYMKPENVNGSKNEKQMIKDTAFNNSYQSTSLFYA